MTWHASQVANRISANLMAALTIRMVQATRNQFSKSKAGSRRPAFSFREACNGIANPTAIVMSAAMMLNYLNEVDASRRILGALDKVYREGKHTTRDVGGTATTQEFTRAVITEMGAQ